MFRKISEKYSYSKELYCVVVDKFSINVWPTIICLSSILKVRDEVRDMVNLSVGRLLIRGAILENL